jgi:hypothetical protein
VVVDRKVRVCGTQSHPVTIWRNECLAAENEREIKRKKEAEKQRGKEAERQKRRARKAERQRGKEGETRRGGGTRSYERVQS